MKSNAQKQVEEAVSRWVDLCLLHIQTRKQRLKEKNKDERPKRN